VPAPPATILMLSVDEAARLRHSLPAAVAQPGADVLVVDNASSDDTAAIAAAHGARHLRLAQRLSYCAAVNAGIAACEREAVLLLNADCVLDAGFLAAAGPRLREPGVGSVAPRLLRSGGVEADTRTQRVDAAGMSIDRRRRNSLVGHNAPADRYRAPGEAFGGDGAAVLYRRETLQACALEGEVLDEDFALWAADADLAWRARLLGWRCVYEPGAVGWHVRFYSPSTRAGLPEEHRRLQFRNRYLMIAKNDSARELLRDLPFVAGYELLALGHVLLRERHLLRGYREALGLLPAALRRRRVIQARRVTARTPFGLTPAA
jgi:GT2 family glycosyltransferase